MRQSDGFKAHLGRENGSGESAVPAERETHTAPHCIAGDAIEWEEIRHVGASERLGSFVRRQYEPVGPGQLCAE